MQIDTPLLWPLQGLILLCPKKLSIAIYFKNCQRFCFYYYFANILSLNFNYSLYGKKLWQYFLSKIKDLCSIIIFFFISVIKDYYFRKESLFAPLSILFHCNYINIMCLFSFTYVFLSWNQLMKTVQQEIRVLQTLEVLVKAWMKILILLQIMKLFL